jgi:hypothetical protein
MARMPLVERLPLVGNRKEASTMAESPELKQPSDRARVGAVLLGLFACLMAVKGVEKGLASQLGEWGAFGVGVLAGCGIGLVVTLIVYKLLARK